MVARTPKGPPRGRIQIPGQISTSLKNVTRPTQITATSVGPDTFTLSQHSHPDVRFGVTPIGDFGSRIPRFLSTTNICHIRWSDVPEALEGSRRHNNAPIGQSVDASNLAAVLQSTTALYKPDVPTFLDVRELTAVDGSLFNSLIRAARAQRWNAPIFLTQRAGHIDGFWHPTAAAGENPALIIDIGALERRSLPYVFEQITTGDSLDHLKETPILIRLHGNLSRLSAAERGQLKHIIHAGLFLCRNAGFRYVGVGTSSRDFIAELNHRDIRFEDSYRSASNYRPPFLPTQFNVRPSLMMKGAMPLRSLPDTAFSHFQPTTTSIGQIPTSEQYLARRGITPDGYRYGLPVVGTHTYSPVGALNGLLLGQPQTLLIGSFGALLTLQMTPTDCIYGTDITTSVPILGDIAEPLLTEAANHHIVSILKRFPLFFTLDINLSDITRRFQKWAERLVGHFAAHEYDRVVIRTASKQVIAASDSPPNETDYTDYYVQHGQPIVRPDSAFSVAIDMTTAELSVWDALEDPVAGTNIHIQNKTNGRTALLYHVYQDRILGLDIDAAAIESTDRLIDILFHFMSRHSMVERRGRMVKGKLKPLPYPIRVTLSNPLVPEVIRDQFESWDATLTENGGPGITIITPARQFTLGHNSHRLDQSAEFGRFSAYYQDDFGLLQDQALVPHAAEHLSPYQINDPLGDQPDIREIRGFGTIHPDAQNSLLPKAYTHAALQRLFEKFGLDEHGDLELLSHYVNGSLFPEFEIENSEALRISLFYEAANQPDLSTASPPLGFLFLASSPKQYPRINPQLLQRIYQRHSMMIDEISSCGEGGFDQYDLVFRFEISRLQNDSVIVFTDTRAPQEAERLMSVATTLQQSINLDKITDRMIDVALAATYA